MQNSAFPQGYELQHIIITALRASGDIDTVHATKEPPSAIWRRFTDLACALPFPRDQPIVAAQKARVNKWMGCELLKTLLSILEKHQNALSSSSWPPADIKQLVDHPWWKLLHVAHRICSAAFAVIPQQSLLKMLDAQFPEPHVIRIVDFFAELEPLRTTYPTSLSVEIIEVIELHRRGIIELVSCLGFAERVANALKREERQKRREGRKFGKQFHWSVLKFLLITRHPLSVAGSREHDPINFADLSSSCYTLQSSCMLTSQVLLALDVAENAGHADPSRFSPQLTGLSTPLDFATNTGLTPEAILLDFMGIMEASGLPGPIGVIEASNLSVLVQLSRSDPAMIAAIRKFDYMSCSIRWMKELLWACELPNQYPGIKEMMTSIVPYMADHVIDTAASLLTRIMHEAFNVKDLRSQAVLAGAIPTMEILSYLPGTDIPKSTLIDALTWSIPDEMDDPSPTTALILKQLHVCSLRINKHPEASEVVKKAWRDLDWVVAFPPAFEFGGVEEPDVGVNSIVVETVRLLTGSITNATAAIREARNSRRTPRDTLSVVAEDDELQRIIIVSLKSSGDIDEVHSVQESASSIWHRFISLACALPLGDQPLSTTQKKRVAKWAECGVLRHLLDTLEKYQDDLNRSSWPTMGKKDVLDHSWWKLLKVSHHISAAITRVLRPDQFLDMLERQFPEARLITLVDFFINLDPLTAMYPPSFSPNRIDFIEGYKSRVIDIVVYLGYPSVSNDEGNETLGLHGRNFGNQFHWTVLFFLLAMRHPLSEAACREKNPIDFTYMFNSNQTLFSSCVLYKPLIYAIAHNESVGAAQPQSTRKPLDYTANTGIAAEVIFRDHVAIVEALGLVVDLRMMEATNLAILVELSSGDPGIMETIRTFNYVNRSVRWLREILLEKITSIHDPRAEEKIVLAIPHVATHFVRALASLIDDESTNRLSKVDDLWVEAVHSGIISTLEILSFRQGVDVAQLLDGLIPGLTWHINVDSRTPGPVAEALLKQLRISSLRVNQNPDASDVAKKAWRDHDWVGKFPQYITFGRVEEPVCGAIGCRSLVEAKMKCMRCGDRYYCDKECQRVDWKSHKVHCAQLQT
ncbi:hypothetical protein DL93DRAFT_2232225 [Clavulina sp. PMI_390]|nr:hypothetical protein DL93DRAFT_2232225 [Clavulina sp. PMI_390]